MGSGFRLRAQTPAKRLKLSKSEVPTCRGPVRVETQIPSPRFVSKRRESSWQEKSDGERNESNQGWVAKAFESQVSTQRKGANPGHPACGLTQDSLEVDPIGV